MFLVSRIREEFDRSNDAQDAVSRGLATTGELILTAGIIMTSVFLTFATNPSPVIEQIAFGLAVAIAVDAIIIRLVVVPAWLPGPVDRTLPHLEVS